jgi:glycosyltransferase involved in cell wall biosynthesis
MRSVTSASPEIRRPVVSIIIPAFNEEGNVARLLERIDEGLAQCGLSGEIVFVDDGSTDGTWSAVERERERRPGLRTFRHRRNLGLSEALNTGFRNVRGDCVIFLPADLQSDPAEDIPKIVGELEAGNDVVVGWRIGRREGKLLVSLIYNFLSRRLFGVEAHDLNWIKGFRREVIDAIHLRSDWHRYVVVLAAGKGFRVKEIRTNYYPRHSGRSKFGRKRILRGLLDLLVVKFEMSFTDKPMLLFGSWGVALLGSGILLGILLVLQKLFTGFGSRPLLFLVMLLVSVGIQLLGLGFLSELIVSLRERMERRETGGGSWATVDHPERGGAAAPARGAGDPGRAAQD